MSVQCNTGHSFKAKDASKKTVTAVCSADRTWQVDAESQQVTDVLPEECKRESDMTLNVNDWKSCGNSWILFLALDCGEPPAMERSFASPYAGTTFEDQIYFRCYHGHWFARDVYDVTVTCEADGKWSNTDSTACRRKYKNYNKTT